MSMADVIKQKRIEKRFTQEELAERLGLQKSEIEKYEHGKFIDIKKETILRLAKIFDCSLTHLLDIHEPILDYFTDNIEKECKESLVHRAAEFLKYTSLFSRITDFQKELIINIMVQFLTKDGNLYYSIRTKMVCDYNQLYQSEWYLKYSFLFHWLNDFQQEIILNLMGQFLEKEGKAHTSREI